jgi:hypothetical protein
MIPTRREFLEQLTGSAALLGALPFTSPSGLREFERSALPSAQSQEWDVSWTKRVTGKHKAVFDVPEVESGYGVWRASIWMNQYRDTLGASEKDLRTVLILRHNGIALAMTQPFWSEYGIGKLKNVTHPLTQQPTDRAPRRGRRRARAIQFVCAWQIHGARWHRARLQSRVRRLRGTRQGETPAVRRRRARARDRRSRSGCDPAALGCVCCSPRAGNGGGVRTGELMATDS